MFHNLAYYVGYEREKTADVDLGKTIFDDDHDMTRIMLKAYCFFSPFFYMLDKRKK